MDAPKAWTAFLGLVLAPCAGMTWVMCMAPIARAESAGRSVVIVVEGGAGDAVASQIASHVSLPNVVRDARPFLAALATRGTHLLAPAIDKRAIRSLLVKRAHAAADESRTDLAILVAHRRMRREVRGHLWIIDAHTEGTLVDQDLASTNPNDEATEVWTAAASLFPSAAKETASKAAASAPAPSPAPSSAPSAATHAATAAPSPEPDADRGPTPLPESASEALTSDNALLVVQANIEAASRHVSYKDRLTASLRPYDLFAVPLASIAVEVYPFARLRVSPVIDGLGVTGEYARAFGLASSDAAGRPVGTQWQSFGFGLRERIGLGRAITLRIDAGYGDIDFTFEKPAFAALLPSVGYRFLRGDASVRAAQGAFAVYGGAGYLYVLSTGEMGGLFPRESVGGIEARIGASYELARAFELSLALGYTRFFYSMHPQPGDANVAGGAIDEMARLSLGLAYLL